MHVPSNRFFPVNRRYRAADQMLPLLGAVFGVSLCVFLWVAPEIQLLQVPVFFGCWLLGIVAPRFYAHPGRCLGIVPWCVAVAFILAVVVESFGEWSSWTVGIFCLFDGLAVGAILKYRNIFRTDQRGMILHAGLGAALIVAAVAAFTAVGEASDAWKAAYHWLLLAVAFLPVAVAWVILFRMAVEFSLEVPFRTMYNASVAGPGATKVPLTGPCLIIANHGAWFDPVFMGKVIDRELTPMMTASFYDIKFLTPLMKICYVIRVPEKPLKRDAPEVLEAIAAIDAGHCVLIFPEGYLRRKEEQYVRRFGQGAWQILAARPSTPVIPCWIEGSWGSYFSYFNGPPTRNKKVDLRRRIVIAIDTPRTVPVEILADSIQARAHLANLVLGARSCLGLPPAPPVEVAMKGDDD